MEHIFEASTIIVEMEHIFSEPTVIVAFFVLISAIVSVVSPLILSKMQASQRHEEKEEDWKRQDEVAKKAAEVAKKASEAAILLKEFNEKNEKSNELIQNQLTVIHSLVNSSLTAQIQATLDSTKRELVLMTEIVNMKENEGKKILPISRRAIELTKLKIEELETELTSRLTQVNSISNSESIPKATKEQIKTEKDSIRKFNKK